MVSCKKRNYFSFFWRSGYQEWYNKSSWLFASGELNFGGGYDMNTKKLFLTCFAVCLVLSTCGLCVAQAQTTTLTVKEIVFRADEGGKEKVAVLCNQACVPVLSGLEGKKPRIVMDFTGVSSIDSKYRKVATSGKFVKTIRSYLDNDSKKLRVVLDMAPSKDFFVHATQDQTVNSFSLEIAEKRRAKGKQARTKESRISIVDRAQRPIDKDLKPGKITEKQEPVRDTKVAVDEKSKLALEKNSTDKGRSQMNAGDYTGAIKTFTEIIAENPRDSLSYRLRGNAYQNIGDRQKAVGDWITAARLGDQLVQSYLDYMQINWKETQKP
jgi:tetratricopeptide (TPR) repeat protein